MSVDAEGQGLGSEETNLSLEKDVYMSGIHSDNGRNGQSPSGCLVIQDSVLQQQPPKVS